MRYRSQLVAALCVSLLLVGVGCSGDDEEQPNQDGPDVAVDAGDEPDAGPTDTGDEDTGGPDTEPISDDGGTADVPDPEPDVPQTPDAGKEDSGPETVDSDFDGLTNEEEAQLCGGTGSDPNDSDTDDDGLSDYEEVQAGTNPCEKDTDGDGATDYQEVKEWEDLNPTARSTYNDGVIDGDRWILDACQNITPGSASFYTNSTANWQIALPSSFDNYTNLSISGTSPPVAAAAYDNTTLEVAGMLVSRNVTGTIPSSPEIAVETDVQSKVGNAMESVTVVENGANFTTAGGFTAARGVYNVTPPGNTPVSVRQARDLVLPALGPFSLNDVSGLPNSSGQTYGNFRLIVTVIQRPNTQGPDNHLLAASISPLDSFDNDSKVRFRANDLTNPTNIAEEQDVVNTKCSRQTADKDRPKVEFYWVLDQTTSMSAEVSVVSSFASQFESEVNNTSLDYRFGVTNMDPTNEGKFVVPPGWHTGGDEFKNQVKNRGNYEFCSGTGWGCDGADEDGLYNARAGLEYMLGMNPTQPTLPERIRENAEVITIVLTDDNANTVEDGTPIGDYTSFFDGNTTMFSIVDPGDGNGNQACPEAADIGEAYKKVSQATGGTTSSICGNLEGAISNIIQTASGLSSNYPIEPRPITPSLKVYISGDYVPRNEENGYRYFSQSGAIAFFGSYRPNPDKADDENVAPDRIAVSYDTFVNKCKSEDQGAFNCISNPNSP